MSTGCNYMNSLVGSFGNMVYTSLNEAVGDEGRLVWVQEWRGEEREMMWSLPQWEESSVTWWSIVECPEKVRGNRVSILQVVRAQEKGFALDGRWAKSPIITGRMKETDHYGNSLFTQQFFTELTLCARYGARWWGYKGEQTQTMELKVQWSRHGSHNRTNKYIVYKWSTLKERNTIPEKRWTKRLRVREDFCEKVTF